MEEGYLTFSVISIAGLGQTKIFAKNNSRI